MAVVMHNKSLNPTYSTTIDFSQVPKSLGELEDSDSQIQTFTSPICEPGYKFTFEVEQTGGGGWTPLKKSPAIFDFTEYMTKQPFGSLRTLVLIVTQKGAYEGRLGYNEMRFPVQLVLLGGRSIPPDMGSQVETGGSTQAVSQRGGGRSANLHGTPASCRQCVTHQVPMKHSRRINSCPLFEIAVTLVEDTRDEPFKFNYPKVINFLQASLDSPATYVDTRFLVFSRRVQTRVDSAKAVFAKASSLLEMNCDYFSSLLTDNGFRESRVGTLDESFPEGEEKFTDDYDYLSDSDLESDGDDDDDEDMSSPPDITPHRPASTSNTGLVIPSGKTFLVNNFAYPTWRSLINFINIGEIVFAPLSYDGENNDTRSKFLEAFARDKPSHTLPCSAKSMYRLADYINFSQLKSHAFAHIHNSLTVKNIVHEYFSDFTFRYPAIREMQLKLLLHHYHELKSTAEFDEHIRSLATSYPERVSDVIAPVLKGLVFVPSTHPQLGLNQVTRV
ncbi:hypothetical protein BD410DRAFT_836869 [Rickenella mellea]|uniref:BTB domain-containing protein n=1 Tax=Rickenella mellea TaxID=50990 RepID=A0A4Y7QG47_9AGAM|nr:hypothetical protein BD410DRAFT_836869 [Rickenella mellea]